MQLVLYPVRERIFQKYRMEIVIDCSHEKLPKDFWLMMWRLNHKESGRFLLWCTGQMMLGNQIRAVHVDMEGSEK